MAKYIASNNPSVTGFSARNIWRMKQFYETYQDNEKLFYLELAGKYRYSERDFARIIKNEGS